MIDVPWRWRNYTDAPNARAPEARYQTMPLDEVAALPVRALLRPGGTAWVWYTFPLCAVAPNIVEHSWRLRVQTGGAWGKRTKNGLLRIGTGKVLRGVLEPFMIAQNGRASGGIRGRATMNLIETFADQELGGLARAHSQKPDEVYELIEKLTPGWRRADVYARTVRKGWEGYGDQLGKFPPRT